MPAPKVHLSHIDGSLLVAAYFRGNLPEQGRWTSCCDQVVTLSLFLTQDISDHECRSRFADRGYVGGLYADDGTLLPQIQDRYQELIDLLHRCPHLIEGGGDFVTPADPTYTACRLSEHGIRLIHDLISLFPRKPDFPLWPDRRHVPNASE